MTNEFTALVQRDGGWFIAFSPEVPEANGQGKTKEECLRNLAAAVELVLEDRRQDASSSETEDVEKELICLCERRYCPSARTGHDNRLTRAASSETLWRPLSVETAMPDKGFDQGGDQGFGEH